MKFVHARDLDLQDLPESSASANWLVVDADGNIRTWSWWALIFLMLAVVMSILFPSLGGTMQLLFMLCVMAYVLAVWFAQSKNDRQTEGALLAFAARNRWSYERAGLGGLNQSSLLWQPDAQSTVRHGLRNRMSGWDVAVWDHQVVRGSGKSRQEWRFTVVAVRLDRMVPHIVCDNRHNNGQNLLASLPTQFAGNQELKLEGDFPQHFKVYAPKDYERDALVFLTPDVMQAMMITEVACDFELVDNVAYAYVPGAFHPTKSAVSKLLAVVEMMQKEFGKQNQGYQPAADVKSVAATIEPGGRRLRQTNPTLYLIIASVGVMLWNATFVLRPFIDNASPWLMVVPLFLAGCVVLVLWHRGR